MKESQLAGQCDVMMVPAAAAHRHYHPLRMLTLSGVRQVRMAKKKTSLIVSVGGVPVVYLHRRAQAKAACVERLVLQRGNYVVVLPRDTCNWQLVLGFLSFAVPDSSQPTNTLSHLTRGGAQRAGSLS